MKITMQRCTVMKIIFLVTIVIIVLFVAAEFNEKSVTFRNEKYLHQPISLSNNKIRELSDLSNITHVNEVLDNICIVRVVGSPGHTLVKNYIKKTMRDLNWDVKTDTFQENVPIFGRLEFENIITTLNPNARRFLALACHYDSKYFRENNFVGATDSAVPCAQLINLATVMNNKLKTIKQQDLSLMFIFFDGEEAFKQWGPKDSIYGAKHLAARWHNTIHFYEGQTPITALDKLDILVLLDLIGAPDPKFYNYFEETANWYSLLVNAESKLANLNKFENYTNGRSRAKYFQPYSVRAYIEDDHIPFLNKNVPVLHLIPHPFPSFWHEPEDNRNNIALKTTENINKILRVFVASYLHL
ncbi:glutaminyl-peptide cyclotransferase [Prorops nasuta]|uniref:glutaminyl-peptide cyclotransferase n=1 Tax=Prorops nasuta TaxID=863751 RepID=UPI0034CE1CD8